jgi:hypothetical protein
VTVKTDKPRSATTGKKVKRELYLINCIDYLDTCDNNRRISSGSE